jgi:hypothetical protein
MIRFHRLKKASTRAHCDVGGIEPRMSCGHSFRGCHQ